MKKFFTLLIFLMIVTLISNAQNDCNPATIINVEREGSGNRVNWTMPISGEEVMISHSEKLANGVGWEQNSFGAFHRFTPEDLSTTNGGILNQVVFVPTCIPYIQTQPGHTYTIQIYKGGKWDEIEDRNPGTLLASTELDNNNLLFNEENTITLDTPVTIDALQELWIGYYCTNIDSILETDKFPAGCDDGPQKDGFGNILFYQNQWITLFELNPWPIDINWCIKGVVQTIDGKSVNIYCNDTNIADNISGTTYFHSNPAGEEQCYKVEVNCLEGGISPLSNEICIEGVGIKDNEQKGKFTVYPNPTRNELRVTSYELQDGVIEIYDVFGKNLIPRTPYLTPHTSLDISALSAGIYFIRLSDGQSFSVQRFVKE